MTYFKYANRTAIVDGVEVEPCMYLTEGSVSGIQSGSFYYGCTRLSNISALAPFNVEVITEAEYWLAIGDEQKAIIAAGYNYNGIILAIDDAALARWTQTLVLLRELNAPDTMPFTVADKDGVMHQMPVSQVREALAGLGMYWYQKWNEFNTVPSGSI